MNKTVNINLAGASFHIDENAFGKLQRYLDAIRKSLSDPQGGDEIMQDIEARIAELFSEKLETASQVVTLKELDEVITVMGQPEDYMVDEEIFEDGPSRKAGPRTSKKLYRDLDNRFISGVSAGLGHYFNIDSIWIRLIWILLVLLGFGTPILVYILLWILVPGAETTAEKLRMTGDAVNISNIERKIKEELDGAADKIKNADYDKYGKKIRKGTSGFFDTLGSIIVTLLKIFVKFLGILLIIISLSTLIGLIIGLFTFGSVGFWGTGEIVDYINLVDTTNAPVWLVSLLVLFAVGIPFFVLFILGLKMLIDNLKSIGTPAKITLLVVWLASIIGLGILGVKQATETAFEGEYIEEQALNIGAGDTLILKMNSDSQYEYQARRRGGLKIEYTSNDEKVIYSNDIRLIVRSTSDSIGNVLVEKKAEGKDYLSAKDRARAINHNYTFDGKTLLIDGFFTTDIDNKYRDQEIEMIVYLPEGTILYADDNTYTFHRNDSYYRDILDNGYEEQYLMIEEDRTRCLDCPSNQAESSEGDWEQEIEESFNDDGDGVYYKDEDGDWVRINKDGLQVQNAEGDRVIINKDGASVEEGVTNDSIPNN